MSVRQRQRNETERKKGGKRRRSTDKKIWNLKEVKNIKFISHTIKFSSHKSNLTAREK